MKINRFDLSTDKELDPISIDEMIDIMTSYVMSNSDSKWINYRISNGYYVVIRGIRYQRGDLPFNPEICPWHG